MSTDLDHLPTRREDVLLVDDGRDSTLVSADEVTIHLLNPTARAIWDLCDGATRPREMIAAICVVFSVGRERATIEVVRTLRELAEAGLIHGVGGDGAAG